MAKTVFTAGDEHLTPDFMDASFGIDADTGHDHDGTDDDGSCPKIDLTSGITGILPYANIGTSGTVGAHIAAPTYYTDQEDFDINWWVKHNIVFLRFPAVSSDHASSTSINISPDTAWPASILCGTFQSFLLSRNNDSVVGAITIPSVSTNDMALYCPDTNGLLGNNFSISGKGIWNQTICYAIP